MFAFSEFEKIDLYETSQEKLKITTGRFFPSELDGRTRFLTVFRFTRYNGNCEYTASALRKIIIITLRAVYLTSGDGGDDDVLRVSAYDYNYYEITSTFSYSWCNYVSSAPPHHLPFWSAST